jgi:hypothetical protein
VDLVLELLEVRFISPEMIARPRRSGLYNGLGHQTLRRISSRSNPLVTRFREAARGRGAPGVILLDGEHLVEEALDSAVTLDTVAIVEGVVDLHADGLVDRLAARGRRGRPRARRSWRP